MVYSRLQARVARLVREQSAAMLSGRRIGLEKESLRVSASGVIATTDHPQALGATLTHPSITTDFSEALLEMVTPPCANAGAALDYLTAVHQFILARLENDEHLWNTSMPCVLQGAESIRIGEYGNSHNGRMKQIYRRGLAVRYGKRMQAIAGIHFNFSLPESAWGVWQKLQLDDAAASLPPGTDRGQRQVLSGDVALRTRGYFQMLQNLTCIGWMVPYLFGASPAVCKSFLEDGEASELETLNVSTRYAPYGTSLRMGNIGYRYREDEPIDLSVRHSNFHDYVDDIITHVRSAHPPYAELGLLDAHGQQQQLSTNRLQIENEFYSTVRPKQIAEEGEMPILALKKRGIRYLELRSVDLNVFHPAGIQLEQVAMLELLMLFAWLGDARPMNREQVDAASANAKLVAHHGREPGLELAGPDGPVSLASWGLAVIDALEPLALWLDDERGGDLYATALTAQRAKLNHPELTPSARMLDGIRDTGSFFEFVERESLRQHEALMEMPIDTEIADTLMEQVRRSAVDKARLEQSSAGSFDDFLQQYFRQLDVETAAREPVSA